MVFYFESEGYLIYVGKDKFENEKLIEFGLDTDIWFHVDNLSSAHVYLRLKEEESIDTIPESILIDCCQLVKANSIKGNKITNLSIVYTPWSNLKKTNDMVDGQVGFHDNGMIRKKKIEKRINSIVNRLNKTKKEVFPDLRMEKEEFERRKEEERKEGRRKEKEEKEQEEKERKEKERLLRYTDLFEEMNDDDEEEAKENLSDDFW